MEEELSESELEERLYAMIHHVDETQTNNNVNIKQSVSQIIENVPRSTARRYWGNNDDQNSPFQKLNTPKETPNSSKTLFKLTSSNKSSDNIVISNNTKSKNEASDASNTSQSVDLTVLQSPITHNVRKVIEILDHDIEESHHIVELESSDDDEVVEVALPPKPTITIESSDEEEPQTVPQIPEKDVKSSVKNTINNRSHSASPVPSTVSSVSDEFIRGDCIALNISSRHPDNHSFDFSLHGSDLIDQISPSRKKKKRKSKDRVTSTPLTEATPEKSTINNSEEHFATPKSKAKNKRQRTKSYTVSEKSLPNADVYDSDSNQSVETNKNKSSSITNESLPQIDVHESDTNQFNKTKTPEIPEKIIAINNQDTTGSKISITPDKSCLQQNKSSNNTLSNITPVFEVSDDERPIEVNIHENIVMGNVSGFNESDDYGDISVPQQNIPKYGSTKVPAILYEDLDFDNLKGNNKVCHRRKYSLTTLRAEMEKFYNESWGGENFNHREIQKSMSRDKSLWMIDAKDRMSSHYRKKSTCKYCNRPGHRDDMCRFKPPICYMCGSFGHFEPRCPAKICVNCGSPNHMYTNMCRNCSTWNYMKCAECGQTGHPSSHCPDIWRRYHNTITNNSILDENRHVKKHYQMFCSGCSQRGHLVHTCRICIPFSGLPINSPYVAVYRPVYPSDSGNKNRQNSQDSTITSASATPLRADRSKRQSKSPTVHETHVNKKRSVSISDSEQIHKKLPGSKETTDGSKDCSKNTSNTVDTEKALDFIPISSPNHDKQGQIIQDNQVSDTSNVVTSARIYVTSTIINQLKAPEGLQWLTEMSNKHNITVEFSDVNSFLNIKGKVGDQESFQNDLRDWTQEKPQDKAVNSRTNDDACVPGDGKDNIPRNRNNLLRTLTKAFESLKEDLGDPNALYKELIYFQNHHSQLLKQKIISPLQLANNKKNINKMSKKLNILLLGQAGLADGSRHISELYALQDKLVTLRQKKISDALRQEIGEHYHSIFTTIPRADYLELLKKYYISKQNSTIIKRNKKKKNVFQLTKTKLMSLPNQRKLFSNGNNKEFNDGINIKQSQASKLLVEKTRSKLVFYHKRLMHARPIDTVLKKTRIELVRKLHSLIATLMKNEKTSAKNLKKMRRVQEQAQLFLTNV